MPPSEHVEAADRFAVIARRFCSVIDSAQHLSKVEFLGQVYQVLPDLIGEAVRLPEVDVNRGEGDRDEALIENVRPNHGQWSQLYRELGEKLGDSNLYWEVFDPRQNTEPVRGSLADDMADIYRDLKGPLVLNDTREASAVEIVWHWRFHFYCRWGKHATDALRVLHLLVEDSFY
jgi:Domain of unknown function (DUF5063)